jgi:hypothetical protein
MGTSPKDAIRVGRALPGAGVPSSAPRYDYADLLGKRAVIRGGGENITFDAQLPRAGVLVKQIALDDWGSDWLVLHFDDGFEYDGSHVGYCLVRARWLGVPIGSEFCPVFVLTDARRALSAGDHWQSSAFQFINWAFVELEKGK